MAFIQKLKTVARLATGPFWRALAMVCIFSPCLTGCIHWNDIYFHDDQKAKTAAETLQLYRSFQTNSGDVFDVMLDNLARVQQSMASLEAAAAQQKFEIFCDTIGYQSWENLQTNLLVAVTNNAVETKALDSQMAETVQRQLALTQCLTNAQAALDKLEEQVNAAQKERLQWLARGEFFDRVLIYYTAQATNLSKLDKTVLESAKDTILTNIVEGTNTIQDVLKDDLSNLEHFKLGTTAKNYTVDLFDPNKAPGITVQILSLGADVAAAEVDRVQLDIAWLKSLQVAYTNSQQALASQSDHITQASIYINRILAPTNYAGGIKIIQSLENCRTNSEAEVSLTKRVSAIQLYLLAETLDESLIRELATKPDAIEHEHSIRLSKINASEREAMILRALQGLNAYHQGGITPEEIANFIRAAEAAGVGVIGARVGS